MCPRCHAFFVKPLRPNSDRGRNFVRRRSDQNPWQFGIFLSSTESRFCRPDLIRLEDFGPFATDFRVAAWFIKCSQSFAAEPTLNSWLVRRIHFSIATKFYRSVSFAYVVKNSEKLELSTNRS